MDMYKTTKYSMITEEVHILLHTIELLEITNSERDVIELEINQALATTDNRYPHFTPSISHLSQAIQLPILNSLLNNLKTSHTK